MPYPVQMRFRREDLRGYGEPKRVRDGHALQEVHEKRLLPYGLCWNVGRRCDKGERIAPVRMDVALIQS